MAEATRIDVTVKFEEGTGHDGFSFTPSSIVDLSGNAAGTNNYAVVFTLEGPDNPTFDQTAPVLWTVDPPPSLQSGQTLPTPEANQLIIGVNNDNTGTQTVSFGCYLLIRALGTLHLSPDPEIVLDPP